MVLVGLWKTGVRKLWPATQLLMSRKHCAKLEPCCHMCAWGSGMALMLLEGFQTMFKRCFWIPLSFPVLCLVKGINILVLLPLFCHMLGSLWFFVSPFFLYLTCFLSVTGLRQVIFLLIFYCFIGQLNKFQYFKIIIEIRNFEIQPQLRFQWSLTEKDLTVLAWFLVPVRLTKKWTGVPYLQSTFMDNVRGKRSIVACIWHSEHHKQLFNKYIRRMKHRFPIQASRIKDLQSAAHRHSSASKPLGRFLMFFPALVKFSQQPLGWSHILINSTHWLSLTCWNNLNRINKCEFTNCSFRMN